MCLLIALLLFVCFFASSIQFLNSPSCKKRIFVRFKRQLQHPSISVRQGHVNISSFVALGTRPLMILVSLQLFCLFFLSSLLESFPSPPRECRLPAKKKVTFFFCFYPFERRGLTRRFLSLFVLFLSQAIDATIRR